MYTEGRLRKGRPVVKSRLRPKCRRGRTGGAVGRRIPADNRGKNASLSLGRMWVWEGLGTGRGVLPQWPRVRSWCERNGDCIWGTSASSKAWLIRLKKLRMFALSFNT